MVEADPSMVVAGSRRSAAPASARIVSTLLLGIGIAGCLISDDVQGLLFLIGFAGIGTFLAWKLPTHPVGWLLVAAGWGLALGSVPLPSDTAPLIAGTATLGDQARAWAAGSGFALVFMSFVGITVLFPSGRLPQGRAGIVARIVVVAVAVLAVLLAFGPKTNLAVGVDIRNPAGLIPADGIGSLIPLPNDLYPSMFAAFVVGVGVLLDRFRRSTGHERLQYRWLVAAIVLVMVTNAIWAVSTFTFGADEFGPAFVAVSIAYLAIPASIAVAVLRYRLWEIDRIVNRAVVYGAVTAILAGVFAAATVLAQRVFILATGQSSDAAVVLVTLGVATLYVPVRRRVESVVDRWLKYDQRLFGAYESDLEHVLALVEPSHAAARLARETVAELGAVGAAVVDGSDAVLASAGTWPAIVAARVAVDTAHPCLAAVLIGPRRDGQSHDPHRLARLAEIAGLADLAVRESVARTARATRAERGGA
jgi:hypothetical protein